MREVPGLDESLIKILDERKAIKARAQNYIDAPICDHKIRAAANHTLAVINQTETIEMIARIWPKPAPKKSPLTPRPESDLLRPKVNGE